MNDHTCDFLSVGSGAGGLAAAITAAEHGARVIVVEKASRLGGVTAWSGGSVWVGANHLAKEAGIEDSVAETRAYLDYLSAGQGHPDLREAFIGYADEAVRYLREKAKLDFSVIRGYPDYYFPKAPGAKPEGRYLEVEPFLLDNLGALRDRLVDPTPIGMGVWSNADLIAAGGDADKFSARVASHVERGERCGGAALAAALVAAAAERGVKFWTQSRAVRLLKVDGAVCGAEVQGLDGTRTVKASAVLLAAGGYDWNAALVQSFEHISDMKSVAPSTVEGDHIVMAGEVGAMLDSAMPEATPRYVGFPIPGLAVNGEQGYTLVAGARPGAIMVNQAGKRFADESFYPHVSEAVARYSGADPGRENWPAWLVFDANHLANYPIDLTGHIPRGHLPAGVGVEASSLSELARVTGIEADELVTTIDRFNGQCAVGIDDDFGRGTVPYSLVNFADQRVRPNPLLGPVGTAPFYAIRLSAVGIGVPSVGLAVDPFGRVLSTRGEPIRGLYAAGNSAARSDIPAAYNSGLANARGLLFGYRAALAAM